MYRQQLAKLTHKKTLRPPPPPQSIDLTRNDYLGLAGDPRLVSASQEALETYGTSASSSRLLGGNVPLYPKIESLLESYFPEKKSLLFNSGYQANSSILTTVSNKKTLLILDHQCHRSLIESAKASVGIMRRFRHNSPAHLKAILEQHAKHYDTVWIVTESVFSMDGSLAPLEEIADLKEHYGAYLYVDEAHAFGVFGPQGLGRASKRADLVLATFGKALGSFGAFVVTTPLLYDLLLNLCPSLIYTTALPPAVLGANLKALEILPHLHAKRAHLKSLWQCAHAQSPIVRIPTPDPHALAQTLTREGIFTSAILPPTYPNPMLRLSLHANLSLEDMRYTTAQIKKSGPNTE